ncbi:MAG: glycosyltransferase family 4 protein [Vicinamibacterales bacterium]
MGLRIGIDATCWANSRGYGRYTREVVSELISIGSRHTFICFLDDRSAAHFDLTNANLQREIVRQRVSPTLAATSGGGRSPLDMLRLTGAVRRASLDVFFSPSVYGYFPLPPGLPAAVTVHDAIPERFPSLTLPTRRDRWLWWAKVRLALAQARVILTVSEYAARDIATYLRVPRSRIRVTLEGVAAEYRPSESAEDVRAAAERVGLPANARWLMYVGGFGAHKHVDLLVRAHAAVAKRHRAPPLMLVLAGLVADGFHQDAAGVEAAIQECGTQELVRWTGYLPDAELRHLHSGAVALALVSASEGFGLPAVEAARCGVPVIATTESPLPEILEGGGLFVQPGSRDAIEAALERLVTDEPTRRAMGLQALKRASELSWPRSAGIVLKTLEDLVLSRQVA